MKATPGCARHVLLPLVALGLGLTAGPSRAQDFSRGIASWAEATFGRANAKWVGQRVAAPAASERPPSLLWLDSERWPLRVHVSSAPGRDVLGLARAVLASAEDSYALLAASGLFTPRAGTNPGQALRRDLYIADRDFNGALADAVEVTSDLDAVSAFALLDARVPARQRDACVLEALLEAELFELDPAESASVRAASARYFTDLARGEGCTPAAPRGTVRHDALDVLHTPAALAAFFHALGARQDHNRGVFLHSLWHFARQKTWEGSGLRGSPDLFEALAKALELSHERLEEVTGELVNASALAARADPESADPERLRFSRLPAHLAASAPLGSLDSSYQLLDLEGARPGVRLVIWARGEYGARWVLSATRLSAAGEALGTVNAPVHKNPDTELTLELDAATRAVLVSVTNLGSGLPDPDLPAAPERTRSVRLILAVPE